MDDRHSTKRTTPLSKPPAGGRVGRILNARSGYMVTTRSDHCTYNRVSTAMGFRPVRGGQRAGYEVATPESRFKRRQGSKEVARRALAPPCQRPTLRWRNFNPTPSRFSVTSAA